MIWLRRLWLTAFLVAVGIPCTSSPSRGQPHQKELQIVSQTRLQGSIAPRCGLGGLARRRAFVDSLRREGAPIVLCDGGGFIASDQRSQQPQSRMVWADMARLDYDAVAVGVPELKQWSLIRPLIDTAPLPLVTTNTESRAADSWATVGNRYLILERGGITLGILGAVSQGLVRDRIPGATQVHDVSAFADPAFSVQLHIADDVIRVLPVVDTVRRVAHEIDERVDIIALLAYLTPKEMKMCATAIPEVDVIIGGVVDYRLTTRPLPGLLGTAFVHPARPKGGFWSLTRVAYPQQGGPPSITGRDVALLP